MVERPLLGQWYNKYMGYGEIEILSPDSLIDEEE
jgi:hypothetical protein